MGSIVLRYILKHIRYWVKKKSLRGKTAANNGQKKKTGAKNNKNDADGQDRRFKGPLTYRVFCALKFVISNVDARYARS